MSKKLKLLCSLWFLVCASLSAALTDAWPQMVRADQSATITMVFENEPLLEKPERLTLLYLNDDGLRSDGQPFQYGVRETIPFVIEGNTIKATLRFPGETIHTLTLVDTNNKKDTPVAVFKLYSLKPDFFALRPFKGNFHMHSQFSDGAEKTGSIMVATCRKFGQDFASESDHNAYAGSEEAMAFFHHVPTDMKAYPGEEVHSQGNSVHILSVGSSESMADWFKNNQLSKRGSRFMRRILHMIVQTNIAHMPGEPDVYRNPVISEYYKKKCESKAKLAACCAVMHKLVNIIFAVLRDRKPYEIRTPEEHKKLMQARCATAVSVA